MDRFNFPIDLTLQEEEGGFLITFPDFPEAITQGETIEESLIEAQDCLEEALALRIDEKMEIPFSSSHTPYQYSVSPTLEIVLKVLLYLSLKESNLNQKELANKLKLDEIHLEKITNPRESVEISIFEKIFHILGKEISVNLIPSK